MNADVKAIIDQCPMLSLQLNKGELHRIMKRGVTRGSLWVALRKDGYCLAVTGEVETMLYSFLTTNFGPETRVTQGRKYWNIGEIGDVSKIIRRFGE